MRYSDPTQINQLKGQGMNATLRSIFILVAIVVIDAALFLRGVVFGRMGWGTLVFSPGAMMGSFRPNASNQPGRAFDAFGLGIMGNELMDNDE